MWVEHCKFYMITPWLGYPRWTAKSWSILAISCSFGWNITGVWTMPKPWKLRRNSFLPHMFFKFVGMWIAVSFFFLVIDVFASAIQIRKHEIILFHGNSLEKKIRWCCLDCGYMLSICIYTYLLRTRTVWWYSDNP